jgi:hypothetical protein
MKSEDPGKVLKEAVEKTIDVVDDYVEPGSRNAEETVQKVIETVDNIEVKGALEALDRKPNQAIDEQNKADQRSQSRSR